MIVTFVNGPWNNRQVDVGNMDYYQIAPLNTRENLNLYSEELIMKPPDIKIYTYSFSHIINDTIYWKCENP